VVGLDVSDEMIRQARAASRDSRYFIRLGDRRSKFPWEENFFDKVLSVESFYYYPDQDRRWRNFFVSCAARPPVYPDQSIQRQSLLRNGWTS